MPHAPDLLLKQPDVLARCQFSRSSLYRLIGKNEFPQPYKIGSGRSVRWLDSEITDWLAGLRRNAVAHQMVDDCIVTAGSGHD